MIVYHGSYCIIEEPNVKYSRDDLDFGKGFYITGLEQQAVTWTDKFKRRGKKGYVNIYNLQIEEISQYYKIKEFKQYGLAWLDFILACREGSNCYLEYDLIIGGIADDRVYNTITLYFDQLITKDEALKRLKYYKPNHQICMVNYKNL